LQLTLALLPELSVAVTTASPFSVMCQSISPGPGLAFGVEPGAWVSLIFVPLRYGPATKLLPVSETLIRGFGSTRSVTKRWADLTPPVVACRPTTNPSGNKVPPAGNNPSSGQNPDGFYVLLATDLVDP
jgi:hypothetical protein